MKEGKVRVLSTNRKSLKQIFADIDRGFRTKTLHSSMNRWVLAGAQIRQQLLNGYRLGDNLDIEDLVQEVYAAKYGDYHLLPYWQEFHLTSIRKAFTDRIKWLRDIGIKVSGLPLLATDDRKALTTPTSDIDAVMGAVQYSGESAAWYAQACRPLLAHATSTKIAIFDGSKLK